jgi:DNA-binding HxlR family transcriptional regulator
MSNNSYFQFCPIAMAAELLESRWTMLIIRELCLGSSRFNQLRRGVPRMSPTLLSKRLRELEDKGILARSASDQTPEYHEYELTPAGQDLSKVILDIGIWSKKHLDAYKSLANTDVTLLMWDIKRNLHAEHFPLDNGVVQVHFTDAAEKHRNWWMIFTEQDDPDVGPIEPPQEVDLYLKTDVRTLTAVWLGYNNLSEEVHAKNVQLMGQICLQESLPKWFGPGAFAHIESLHEAKSTPSQ